MNTKENIEPLVTNLAEFCKENDVNFFFSADLPDAHMTASYGSDSDLSRMFCFLLLRNDARSRWMRVAYAVAAAHNAPARLQWVNTILLLIIILFLIYFL